jgi:cytochrome c biogenesis protein CcdA
MLNFFLIIAAFIFGVLTVLAPCVLPLLPVIIGSAMMKNDRRRAIIITTSLAFSIIVFGILLKATTLLINVPQQFLQFVSGGLVLIFGIITLFPELWEHISVRLHIDSGANQLLYKNAKNYSWVGAVAIGMALGPVFTSCSPTYALIVSIIVSQSVALGVVYLIIYAAGLSLV